VVYGGVISNQPKGNKMSVTLVEVQASSGPSAYHRQGCADIAKLVKKDRWAQVDIFVEDFTGTLKDLAEDMVEAYGDNETTVEIELARFRRLLKPCAGLK